MFELFEYVVLCSALDMDAFTAHVLTDHLPTAIIIDCSDSEDVAMRHAQWLEKVRDINGKRHFYRRRDPSRPIPAYACATLHTCVLYTRRLRCAYDGLTCVWMCVRASTW